MLGFAGFLVCGAQDRGGGVNHRSVADCLALLIFGSFHCFKLGHAVGKLTGTGDKRLDIVFDSGLGQGVNLLMGEESFKQKTSQTNDLLVNFGFSVSV